MKTLKKSPKHAHLRLTVLSGALLSLLFATSAQADINDVNKSIENALKFGQDDGKY